MCSSDLYDHSSGGVREGAMLRSKYAEPGTPTFVGPGPILPLDNVLLILKGTSPSAGPATPMFWQQQQVGRILSGAKQRRK